MVIHYKHSYRFCTGYVSFPVDPSLHVESIKCNEDKNMSTFKIKLSQKYQFQYTYQPALFTPAYYLKIQEYTQGYQYYLVPSVISVL
jgi:hypothetical protein